MAAAPVFYTVASLYYPGYNLTQRGSQVVVEAADIDSPFQLWYKDDSWRYLEGQVEPFALINNGSKAALKADDSAASKVSLFKDYDRSKDTTLTTLWKVQSSCPCPCSCSCSCSSVSVPGEVTILSVALKAPLQLGIGKSPPTSGDGVAVVLGFTTSPSVQRWILEPFTPPAYVIQSQSPLQTLVSKTPHTDIKIANTAGSFNNELGVVAVYPYNTTYGDEKVWYRIPAGSPIEDSNSSFFVINKKNGKALKGSTKKGDKVILTEFDPLDNNFVWSEDRSLSGGTNYLAINLANSCNTMHWFLPPTNEYQNASYNRPLTLRKATIASGDSQWSFMPLTET